MVTMLKKLSCDDMSLTKSEWSAWFSALNDLPCLEELSLSEVNMQVLPATCGELLQLKRLNMSYNEFTDIAAMRSLVHLNELDMTCALKHKHNASENLFDVLAQLTKLKVLNGISKFLQTK